MPHTEKFESVLSAARTGAEWAWARLYEDITGTLLGYTRRQGALACEDLVAETWLHVARSIHKFEGDETAFRSWIFTIAHHRIIDERRRLSRKPLLRLGDPQDSERGFQSVESSEDVVIRHESEALLMETLGSLSRDQREVVLLRFYAGFGVSEVGRIMGKSPGAVQALQGRALKQLKKKLQKDSKFSQASSVTEVE